MRTLALAMMAYVALAATVFVIVYHVLAAWWRTPVGINIMALLASIAVTLDLALVFNLTTPPWWLPLLAAFLYFVMGTVIWWRLALLVSAQREKRDSKAAS